MYFSFTRGHAGEQAVIQCFPAEVETGSVSPVWSAEETPSRAGVAAQWVAKKMLWSLQPCLSPAAPCPPLQEDDQCPSSCLYTLPLPSYTTLHQVLELPLTLFYRQIRQGAVWSLNLLQGALT